MNRLIYFYFWIFTAFFLVSARPVLALQQIQTPEDVLFGPASEISDFPIVKKIMKTTHDSVAERARIQYLLARVSRSKLMFVRNGENYPGKRAAMHLAYKYRKRIQHIKTVQNFMNDVATGSAVTGQPYYVKTEDGVAYRVRDVFANELRVLEEYLAQKAQETENHSIDAHASPMTADV